MNTKNDAITLIKQGYCASDLKVACTETKLYEEITGMKLGDTYTDRTWSIEEALCITPPIQRQWTATSAANGINEATLLHNCD